MPQFDTIHHINLSVTDLERSAEWYERLLGLQKGWEMEDAEGRGRKTILLHPTSPFRLVLTKHQSNPESPASEFSTGLDHLAFGVPDREALELWQQHLDAHGVEHTPIKEGATGWLIVFRDPDNIQLEIYSQTK